MVTGYALDGGLPVPPLASKGPTVPVMAPVLELMLRPAGSVWTPLTRSVKEVGSALVLETTTLLPETMSPSVLVCAGGAVSVSADALIVHWNVTLPWTPSSLSVMTTL